MNNQCNCLGSNEQCQWCYGTGVVPDYNAQAHSEAVARLRGLNEAEKDRVAERSERLAVCPEWLRNARAEVIRTTDARLKTCKSQRVSDETFGPFLPWHYYAPSGLPVVTLGIDSPTLDINECRDDMVLHDEVHGTFCGSPIVRLDTLGMEVEQMRDTNRRIFASKGTSIPAEILPGEERCTDGIIRRTTTLEYTERA